MTDERRALIIKEIGDVLWYLSAACNELNISLSEAALTNLEKLCDRSERDALRGSGDER
jgi:NTP pyrophosphatase (non-canonical NTP hydrolase)